MMAYGRLTLTRARLKIDVALFDAVRFGQRGKLGSDLFKTMISLRGVAAPPEGLIPLSLCSLQQAIHAERASGLNETCVQFEMGLGRCCTERRQGVCNDAMSSPLQKTLTKKNRLPKDHLDGLSGKGWRNAMADRGRDHGMTAEEAMALGYHKLCLTRHEYEVARL